MLRRGFYDERLTALLSLLRRLARSLWVRAVVSAGLLALVVSRIDLDAAADRLSGGRWWYFAAATAALLASFVVGGLRWHVYLVAAGVDVSRSAALRAYMIGTFTNNFLPSQVGGDVARAWIISERGTRLRSATTVVVDRATALLCLIGIGWLAVAARPGRVPGELLAALGATTAAFAAGSAAGLLIFRSSRLRRALPERFRAPAGDVRRALAGCLEPGVLARTLAVGLLFQGLVGLAAWLVVRSMSLDVSFSVIAAALAPVVVVSAAPVSIGGFGVREGSYVVLLGYAGISATDATLFSLLSAAAFALASLPGAVALLLGGARPVSSSGEGSGSRAGRT